MSERFRADGETWSVAIDRGEEQPGVNAVVFLCVSNPQRPYRVARLTNEEAAMESGELSRDRMTQLFERSDPMDVIVDPEADPGNRHPRTEP